MNVIFFDIDGVLNGTDEFGNWKKEDIQEEKVNYLQEIANKTNSKLVMSSSWRRAWNENGELVKFSSDNEKLHNLLIQYGCPIFSKIPQINGERGKEIKAWISEQKEPINFICIDDEDKYYYDSFFAGKLIHTAPKNRNGAYKDGDIVGLMKKHVEESIQKLGEN